MREDIEGTNWSSLGGDKWLMMGIRTDGTLWAGFTRRNYAFYPEGTPKIFGSPVPPSAPLRLARLGTKSDWVGLTMGGPHYLALEADGTVWAIERNSFQTKRPSRYHDWLAGTGGFRSFSLAKDGTISCWDDFFSVVPHDEYYEGTHDVKTPWFVLRTSRRPLASINILDAK